MATAVIDESELQSLGCEVPVGDIDAELHRFFTGGQGDGGDNPAGIARASLMNLAVYAEEAASARELSATIEELTRETACRAILILARAGGAPTVRSWIQAHCRLSAQGEKTVCTEQVSFLLSDADASLVRNTVFAHLDSDLPLIFWWRGELSDVFEERLYSRLDRFLFDSATWDRPANQFLRLQRALEESGGAFVAHDLAYTRGHPVRTAIARVFDDPAARQALPNLEGFDIIHLPGQRLPALWLSAWIAGRLGGRLDGKASSAGRFLFQTPAASGRVEITCRERRPEESGEEAIGQLHIRLGTAGGVTLRHEADSGFWRLTWRLADGGEREKLFPGRRRTDADLVSEILVRAGRNRAMNEAMPTMRQLLGL